MRLNFNVLSAGVLFFLGSQVATAQKVKKDTVRDIDELVLVGYSKVNRNEFVGTATQINTKSIDNKAVSNVSQALAGEAAGVRVINTTGQPGTSAKIRVRGFGSVNGNRDPLYILDGMPYEGNISVINPDDIATMTILKDATATSIYGARGANGVVVINTKKGRANRSSIQFESKIGMNLSLLPRYEVIKSPEEYISLVWEGLYNQGKINPAILAQYGFRTAEEYANNILFSDYGITPLYNLWNVEGKDLIDPVTRQVRNGVTRKYTPENWQDYAYKPALRTEHNLSMSGGSDKTTYYTSFGYLKDGGYSINSNFERYSTRLNLGFQPKNWLRGTYNMGYAFTKSQNNGQTSDSGSVFWFSDSIPSIYPLFLRDANGNRIPETTLGGYIYDYGYNGRNFGFGTNAIADATYDKLTNTKHELNASLNLEADITKHFTFETRLSGQYFNNSRDNYKNPYYGSMASSGGSISKIKHEAFTWNFLQLLRYKNKFGDHGLEAFAAHEANDYEYKYLGGDKTGLVDPYTGEFNNAIKTVALNSYIENYKLESFFGSVSYDYQNKYLASASVRRDGSSRFSTHKWGTFYSLGLGWVLTKENFLKENSFFSNMKLKASYGTVGDQAGVGYYPGYDVYDIGNFMDAPSASYNRKGYKDLTWEKSRIFQTGLDFSIFKNKRLEGSIDYYNKTTDNLIFDRRLAPSQGNAIEKTNGGALVNQGIEFNLIGHIIKKDDFYLDLSVNGEILRNKLTKMPIDPVTGRPKVIDLSESGFGRAQGYSIYDYYLREWAGVNPNTGAAQWTMHYVDVNKNGVYDTGDEAINSLYEYQQNNPGAVISQTLTESYADATQKFIGKSAIPDLRGGINLSVGYKNISLGAQMLYSIGGYAIDYSYATFMTNPTAGNANWHKDIHNRWQKPGDITNVPRLSNSNRGDRNFSNQSSRFLTKTDYFILNNVNIAYTFDRDFLRGTGLDGLTISLSGDNLWIKSKRKGFNPSTSENGESSRYAYAPLSTFTIGIKANF